MLSCQASDPYLLIRDGVEPRLVIKHTCEGRTRIKIFNLNINKNINEKTLHIMCHFLLQIFR